ncbi:hypothetical protein SUDANB6_04034 [Streptomyces sp. enrichment culture]
MPHETGCINLHQLPLSMQTLRGGRILCDFQSLCRPLTRTGETVKHEGYSPFTPPRPSNCTQNLVAPSCIRRSEEVTSLNGLSESLQIMSSHPESDMINWPFCVAVVNEDRCGPRQHIVRVQGMAL